MLERPVAARRGEARRAGARRAARLLLPVGSAHARGRAGAARTLLPRRPHADRRRSNEVGAVRAEIQCEVGGRTSCADILCHGHALSNATALAFQRSGACSH